MKKKIEIIMKRFTQSIIVLVGLSILIFALTRLMPGDPARLALGPRAPEWAVEQLRDEMYLNEPLYIQYKYWAKGALRGNLGISLVTRRPVAQDIKEFFPASLELALFTGIFVGIMGALMGSMSGWYNNTWIDNVIRVIAYIGVVTPPFVWAIFLILVFSYFLELLPTIGRLTAGIIVPPKITGLVTIDALFAGRLDVFFDALKHLILPVLSLSLGPLSQEARITRASVVANINKDFILNAKICGISERKIFFKYLLKPSLIPTISVLGLDFAGIFAFAFLVEKIFDWPGLSRYCMIALLKKDFSAIVGTILVLGIVFTVVNIVVDLIISFLDPRIDLERGR